MSDHSKLVRAAMLGCEIRKYGAMAKEISGVEGYYWSWDFYRAENRGPFTSADAAADDFLDRYGGTAEYFERTGLRHCGRKLEPAPICLHAGFTPPHPRG